MNSQRPASSQPVDDGSRNHSTGAAGVKLQGIKQMHYTTSQTGPVTAQVPIVSTRKRPALPPPKPREKVLVCCYADGFMEVYGAPNVDVKIVQVPTATERAELGEQFVESSVPKCYLTNFYPTGKRETALLRPVKPSDIAYRKWSVGLLREILALGRDA